MERDMSSKLIRALALLAALAIAACAGPQSATVPVPAAAPERALTPQQQEKVLELGHGPIAPRFFPGQIPNNTALGNVSGSQAPASALTATQLTTLCNAFTSSLSGCVPGSGGGTANFMRADGSWAAPPGTAGSGTVNSGTAGELAYYATSTNAVSAAANASISSGALSLGASGTAGSVAMGNATSGTVTLQPATGALGTVTASLPANTGTIAELNLAQTWSASQALGSSTATTQSAKDNSTKLATTAYVDAPTGLTSGSGGSPTVTLVGPRQYFVCTSTCNIAVPVPAAGYEFCVLNGDNVSTVITMNAIGSSARYENTARTAYGTAGTGTAVSSGAAGDKLCLLGLDSTHYLVASFTGTWTMN